MTGSRDSQNANHSGVKFPPPLIYAGVFVVAFLLEKIFPAFILPKTVSRIGAVLCVAIWVLLTAWSIAQFRRVRTSVVPTKPATALVVSGPYRFSRNPLYVGFTFLYLGLALFFRLSWGLILLPILIGIIQSYVILREERYLEEKFGAAYLAYKARVRRWI